jgi:hypothetical protein
MQIPNLGYGTEAISTPKAINIDWSVYLRLTMTVMRYRIFTYRMPRQVVVAVLA